MISKTRDAGPVLVVDAGQSLAPIVPIPPAELAQRRAKADLIAYAFEVSAMDAMTVGETDWALGVAEVRGMVERHHLPVLAANLVCDGVAPFPASKVVERAGHRIGLVGVTSGAVDGCEVGPLREGLAAAIAGLGTVDVVIALLPTHNATTVKVVQDLVGVDLVIDADPTRRPDAAEPLGAAWKVGSGQRGQMVGATTLTWEPGASGWAPDDAVESAQREVERAQRRVDSLNKRLVLPNGAQDPRVVSALDEATQKVMAATARVAELKSDTTHHHLSKSAHVLDDTVPDEPELQRAVDAFKLTQTAAPAPDPKVAHRAPAGSSYAGSDACRACHMSEYAQWVGTPHATAWASLLKDDRSRDQECVGCHATGVGLPGGPAPTDDLAGLHDVQCESCHGASKAHAAAPPSQKPSSPGDATTCLTCHDGKRDEGRFDFSAYLPRVVHRAHEAAQ